MTRIVAISDTHNQHGAYPIPDGHILIHAGDMANAGRPDEVQPAIDWMASLPHRYKYLIPGNHDVCIDWETRRWAEFARQQDVTLVTHGAMALRKHNPGQGSPFIKAFFSSWTPTYGRGWAFMADRQSEKIKDLWDMIPETTELLVTHGPPHGILDEEEKAGFLCGCEFLRERIRNLPNLKYHLFGHIHEQAGKVHVEDGVTFVNLSMVARGHYPVNKPFVFEMD